MYLVNTSFSALSYVPDNDMKVNKVKSSLLSKIACSGREDIDKLFSHYIIISIDI